MFLPGSYDLSLSEKAPGMCDHAAQPYQSIDGAAHAGADQPIPGGLILIGQVVDGVPDLIQKIRRKEHHTPEDQQKHAADEQRDIPPDFIILNSNISLIDLTCHWHRNMKLPRWAIHVSGRR